MMVSKPLDICLFGDEHSTHIMCRAASLHDTGHRVDLDTVEKDPQHHRRGPVEEKSELLVGKLGLDDKVIFCGLIKREEDRCLVSFIDIFVMPGLYRTKLSLGS